MRSGLRATELVADDGARDGDADRGADALDQAPGEQEVDRRGEGGDQAAEDIDREEGRVAFLRPKASDAGPASSWAMAKPPK